MRKIMLALLFTVLLDAPVLGDSATFKVANAKEEDAFSSRGFYTINGFDNTYGWHFFGYSPYTASYYNAYWRFPLAVPKGSVVTHAYVSIRSDYNNNGDLNAAFLALVPDGKWEAEGAFSTVNYPNGPSLDSIPRRGSPVHWTNIANWTTNTWYNSPDIGGLVQEHIDDPAYDPDDPYLRHFGLVLYYVAGSGFRTGTQEPDDDSFTAKLFVEWTPPARCEDEIEICGDGIDNNCNGEIDEFCNSCPEAAAGEDLAAFIADTIYLDGTASSDSDGDELAFTWTLSNKPEGSAAELSDPASATPTLFLDLPGDYVLELTVNDGLCNSEVDSLTVTASDRDFICPYGFGYWKRHRDAWPVDSLTLGNQEYGDEELTALLSMPVRGDASVNLAHHLIAAKLNIAFGTNPFPVMDTLASADALLAEYSGKLPYKIRPKSEAGRLMTEDARTLDLYNHSFLTPDCVR
ncbi:MAG: hypothetical protein Kow0099_09860 [Candidatus Abyssubacteria bacterium]